MKYLAIILGALSAASAQGSVNYKYVPEKITVAIYGEAYNNGTWINKTIPLDLNNPTGSVPFDYVPSSPVNLEARDQSARLTSSQPIIDAKTKYSSSNTVQPRTTSYSTIHVDNPFTAPTVITTRTEGELKFLNYKTEQRISYRCDVPEYVIAPRGLSWVWTETNQRLYTTGYEYNPWFHVNITCRYTFRVVPEIAITFKDDIMTLTGTAGGGTMSSNRIIATGYGGDGVKASLSIDNPNPSEISVSFSATDPNTTTVTVVPTDSGTSTEFYVKVNNTAPGTREYRVNFTAKYD